MSGFDRVLLTLCVLLAAYQIAIGTDGMGTMPTIAYTIAFGVLLVACLLLIILGFDVLDSPVVVVISSVIPLSLSFGLFWEHVPSFRTAYTIFSVVGLAAIIVTRSISIQGRLPVVVLAVVHAVAGVVIFLLPIITALSWKASPGFVLVSAGGAFIGLGGLLLSFLKAGKPILSRNIILKVLPGLLLLMAAAFVIGFTYA